MLQKFSANSKAKDKLQSLHLEKNLFAYLHMRNRPLPWMNRDGFPYPKNVLEKMKTKIKVRAYGINASNKPTILYQNLYIDYLVESPPIEE